MRACCINLSQQLVQGSEVMILSLFLHGAERGYVCKCTHSPQHPCASTHNSVGSNFRYKFFLQKTQFCIVFRILPMSAVSQNNQLKIIIMPKGIFWNSILQSSTMHSKCFKNRGQLKSEIVFAYLATTNSFFAV